METEPLPSAVVAAATTWVMFYVKDVLIAGRKRRLFAKAVLIHCCRTLLDVIERDPNQFDYLKSSTLENYIDVYLKNQDLDIALNQFLKVYAFWRSGIYLRAQQGTVNEAKQQLLSALEKIATSQ